MAIRDDFAPGEVLTSADLNDTFASKLDLAGGKILQIVRATDATDRSTTSATPVDVSGMSVTITPQKSDSAILIIASFVGAVTRNAQSSVGVYQIADASNNAISGSEGEVLGVIAGGLSLTEIQGAITAIAYATPATTSATTYKLRFYSSSAATNTIRNATTTGQMYAIEVSA